MIDFSQSELQFLNEIATAHTDFLESVDLDRPTELDSILAKIRSNLIRPPRTADLFDVALCFYCDGIATTKNAWNQPACWSHRDS